MKPETVGRTFGIGLRVAGKALAQSLEGSSSPSQSAASVNEAVQSTRAAATQVRSEVQQARSEVVGKAARSTARGVGGFLRPFARIGGILWLEVTGAIFLLFALFFGTSLWRIRSDYASGPHHNTFLLATVFFLIFLYLGGSAFWRARKK